MYVKCSQKTPTHTRRIQTKMNYEERKMYLNQIKIIYIYMNEWNGNEMNWQMSESDNERGKRVRKEINIYNIW